MTAHNRRLKQIQFAIGAVQYECQISNWLLTPPQDDGEKIYTYCPDGAFVEEVDPNWTLALTFYSDWRADGLSDFLMTNHGTDAAFTLDHHPDIPEEHVQWTGTIKLKAPPAGGDARTTESQTVTFVCVDEPAYIRIGV